MASVEVVYTCDVIVTVEPDEGRVTRVQVDDEGAELKYDSTNSPDDLDPRYDEAVAIAQDPDRFWPAWEFGF